jgi:hypothetical protein
MADGESNLEIVISAVDEASASFDQISESMAAMSEAASEATGEIDANFEGTTQAVTTMVDSTTASFNEFMASVEAAAEATGLAEDEILIKMEATGQTAQEVADEIVAANEEVDASNELSKGSFTSIGVAAGIAFYAVESAVSSAITSAQSWDEESAIIAQTLKDTGSSIPVSQVQAYAEQIQSTTLLTQQPLQSEGLILSNKDLQGSYQSLTLLAADLATKMSQTSGTLSDNLPNATKLLANALADPVAGLNQLIRQGTIQFPAATVTMIENMAKVGNTAGADAAIIQALNAQVGGMAQTAAQAPGAGLTQLNNSLTSLGTQVGNDLLPDLDALAKALLPIITGIANWTAEHPKLTEALVAGIVVFTALLAVMTLVGIVIAAVGSAFAAAALAIAAVVALVAAVIIDNWNLIKTDTETIWNGISTFFTTTWNAQKQLFETGLDDIKTIWTTSWTDMSTIVQNIWQTIENIVKTGVNDVISAINGFINALDSLHISLPSIKIPGTSLATPAVNLGFSIPDIPMLAEGGLVTQPTLALIGESGPEAVIPLSGGGGGYGGGQQQIIIQIQGGIFPADDSTMKQIGNLLAKQILRGLRPVTNYSV